MKRILICILLIICGPVKSEEDAYYDIKFPSNLKNRSETDNGLLIAAISMLYSYKSIIDDCENMLSIKTEVIPEYQTLFLKEWDNNFRAISFLHYLQVDQFNNVLGCDFYNKLVRSYIKDYDKSFDKLREKHNINR